MAGRKGATSAASRVFLVLLAAVVVVGTVVALLLVFEAQRAVRAEAERVTRALSETIAATDAVGQTLVEDDPSAVLQPYAETVMAETGVDFITIMTPDGIRVTHRDRDEIGKHYLGTIPLDQETLTEEFEGTLGPSVRTISPVVRDGDIVGWAAVGVTVDSLSSAFLPRLPFAIVIALAVVAAGFVGALAAGRITKRVTGDLPAGSIRDAVSSYESIRTLGEALRAQTHEHGNRMHTAVALLELGRTEEAIEILTETSRQSQELVDQVTARRDGDPTVGALLLGKASQARERGIDWMVSIDPGAPRSTLTPVDAVSVVGNLIDNAVDAAAAGAEPRWVRVELAPAPRGALSIVVSDSGSGIPADIADRVWDHGFSTKPAGADGRGVGLALVRSIVDGAGGSVDIAASPTAFHVVLPGRRP